MIAQISFFVFAAIALVAAIVMLTRKEALDGAIALVVCFLAFAGLYAMLDAPFVAVMQVLVYAGAIMMLIIFVIMTIDQRPVVLKVKKPVLIGGMIAVAIMVLCLTLFFGAVHSAQMPLSAGFVPGTVERIGTLLFNRHVLNFEMVSLLLLTALVGALIMGKKESKTSDR